MMKKFVIVVVFLGVCLGCFHLVEGSDGEKYRDRILQFEQEKIKNADILASANARGDKYKAKWQTLKDAISGGVSMADEEPCEDEQVSESEGV